MSQELLIRRAVPDDRGALVALLDRTFTERPFRCSFSERFPHLFSDAMVGSHHLALSQGEMLGCVGTYRFTANLHGMRLQVGGVGQVATAPEAQGRGVMSRLLDAALAAESDVDLWWLYGDAQRYGRVGFAPGGLQAEILTWERYVREVPAAGPPIRPIDLAGDDARIARMLQAQPFALALPAGQRAVMLTAYGAHGWTDGHAMLLLDPGGHQACCAHGEPAAVARLVAHQVRQLHEGNPKDSGLRIPVDVHDARLLQALRPLTGSLSMVPTACFRIGRLRPLLRAWAAAHPPSPGATLRPSSLDGGAAGSVLISIEDGAWRIEEWVGMSEHRHAGAELASLVLGALPLAAWPLPRDAALHHLLPLHFRIPQLYAL